MPIYSFENTKTRKQFDDFMSYSEKLKFLVDNPHIIPAFTKAPGLVAGVNHSKKNDAGFGELMSKIAEANPHSALAQTHGDKGIAASKKRNAVNKWRKARDERK